MPAFFLALLTCALAALAGRESVELARFSARAGGAGILAVCVWGSAAAASAVAAWLAGWAGPLLFPAAKQMLVAFALAAAAIEIALLRPRSAPREPTRSMGALLIVLFANQMTDAPRFAILALGVATGEPVLAALGGLAGGAVPPTLAILAGDAWEERLPLTAIRVLVGSSLAIAGLVIGLSARGLVW